MLRDLLLSEAIGDIAGAPYEFHSNKNYDEIDLLLSYNDYTDDTVCTFACADALLNHTDMAQCLWSSCRAESHRGYGGGFRRWLSSKTILPAYNSFGNGSAMRVSAAGFMARSEEECIELATLTALPTHNHPEGIKGAVVAALTVYYALHGMGKEEIRKKTLNKYYPSWATRTYEQIHPSYSFDVTCQGTVPAAILSFLESSDYVDCLKKAIALGGDADTLAAIAGPMAYAFYQSIPQQLIDHARKRLPQWMLEISAQMDDYYAQKVEKKADGIRFTPENISALKENEIFVFGSNLQGHHGGGAARVAYRCFGAEWGVGTGMTGQCYAIPTMQGGVETIRPYTDQFVEYAEKHPELTFLVTRIGCGIAGFRDEEIAPLFKKALTVKNIILPETFYTLLNRSL